MHQNFELKKDKQMIINVLQKQKGRCSTPSFLRSIYNYMKKQVFIRVFIAKNTINFPVIIHVN